MFSGMMIEKVAIGKWNSSSPSFHSVPACSVLKGLNGSWATAAAHKLTHVLHQYPRHRNKERDGENKTKGTRRRRNKNCSEKKEEQANAAVKLLSFPQEVFSFMHGGSGGHIGGASTPHPHDYYASKKVKTSPIGRDYLQQQHRGERAS